MICDHEYRLPEGKILAKDYVLYSRYYCLTCKQLGHNFFSEEDAEVNKMIPLWSPAGRILRAVKDRDQRLELLIDVNIDLFVPEQTKKVFYDCLRVAPATAGSARYEARIKGVKGFTNAYRRQTDVAYNDARDLLMIKRLDPYRLQGK